MAGAQVRVGGGLQGVRSEAAIVAAGSDRARPAPGVRRAIAEGGACRLSSSTRRACRPRRSRSRRRVREFLAAERAAGRFVPHRCSWSTFDAEFSRRAGAAGFIGVTWPKEYGGQGAVEPGALRHHRGDAGRRARRASRTGSPTASPARRSCAMARERARRELLAAHLPRRMLLRHRHERAGLGLRSGRGAHARGAGATAAGSINGSKIWTSNAHRVHYLIALVRTGEAGEDRHGGLTQFIVDMSQPGVTVRPIHNLSGGHEFNEVFFARLLRARRHDGRRAKARAGRW